MENTNFGIYRDVPVVYKDRYGRCFYGDIPGGSFNMITMRFEAVINTRGNAYAARKRMKYRKYAGLA